MHRATISLLLVTSLLLPLGVLADDNGDDKDGFFGGPFTLELRAGYTGTRWTPYGLDPYEVDNYGREMLYAELAIVHPLLIAGEAFDLLQIPRLRIESNLGYSASNSGFEELIPHSIRNNPYIRASGWLTFWEWFSFRFREERFQATIIDPRDFGLDEHGNPSVIVPFRTISNRMSDLEIGLIGSPGGEINETMFELGMYFSTMNWPMVINYNQEGFDSFSLLIQEEFEAQGVYAGIITRPIPHVWPVHSQFLLRVGDITGVDARVRFEQELLKSWFLGVQLEASLRSLEGFKNDGQFDYQMRAENPRDVRYMMTLYTVLVLM